MSDTLTAIAEKIVSYSSEYRDRIAGIQFKLDGETRVITREEFMAYLVEVMYTHSRMVALKGAAQIPDGIVVQPRGISEYFYLASAIEPERSQGLENAYAIDGYKLLIGGRLIIAPHGENRYVFDGGVYNKWIRFFGDKFAQLTTRYVFLIYKLYCLCYPKGRTEHAADDISSIQNRIREKIDTLKAEGFEPLPKKSEIDSIARFFLEHDPEIIIETSYRHMAVNMTEGIAKGEYTSEFISNEIRELIRNNRCTCKIRVLPLMLAALFVAEQGRNYTANLSNLVLFEIINRNISIPKIGRISWQTVLTTQDMLDLFKKNPEDKKGQRQAEIGGWMVMSHTGSAGESANIYTNDDRKFSLARLPAAQAIHDEHLDLSCLHPMLKFILKSSQSDMPPAEKANKSRDKAFILIASWLNHSLTSEKIKLLGQKEINLARKNLSETQLSEITKRNKLFCIRVIFPFLIAMLDFYERPGVTAYTEFKKLMELELRTIFIPTPINGNSLFISIILALNGNLGTYELDHQALVLRHELVKNIRNNKEEFRDKITKILKLENEATDDDINNYCNRMDQYTEPGDELCLLIMSRVNIRPLNISRLTMPPLVIMQFNSDKKLVGVVYGISNKSVLNLDDAIVLAFDGCDHYDLIEHRCSSMLSSYIVHDGPIIETIASSKVTELKKAYVFVEANRKLQLNYLTKHCPWYRMFCLFNLKKDLAQLEDENTIENLSDGEVMQQLSKR